MVRRSADDATWFDRHDGAMLATPSTGRRRSPRSRRRLSWARCARRPLRSRPAVPRAPGSVRPPDVRVAATVGGRRGGVAIAARPGLRPGPVVGGACCCSCSSSRSRSCSPATASASGARTSARTSAYARVATPLSAVGIVVRPRPQRWSSSGRGCPGLLLRPLVLRCPPVPTAAARHRPVRPGRLLGPPLRPRGAVPVALPPHPPLDRAPRLGERLPRPPVRRRVARTAVRLAARRRVQPRAGGRARRVQLVDRPVPARQRPLAAAPAAARSWPRPSSTTGTTPTSPTPDNTNYSVLLPLWDLVFGTYLVPERPAAGGLRRRRRRAAGHPRPAVGPVPGPAQPPADRRPPGRRGCGSCVAMLAAGLRASSSPRRARPRRVARRLVRHGGRAHGRSASRLRSPMERVRLGRRRRGSLRWLDLVARAPRSAVLAGPAASDRPVSSAAPLRPVVVVVGGRRGAVLCVAAPPARCAMLGALVVIVPSPRARCRPGCTALQVGLSLSLLLYAIGAWSPSTRRWRSCAPWCPVLVARRRVDGERHGWSARRARSRWRSSPCRSWWASPARSRRRYLDEVEHRLRRGRGATRTSRAPLADPGRAHPDRPRAARRRRPPREPDRRAGRRARGPSLDPSPRRGPGTRSSAIEQSSRDAVGEMHQLLEVLQPLDGANRVTPQPGLADLDDARRPRGGRRGVTSIAVDPAAARSVARWRPTLSLSCYRVVEESLTNVARHSRPGRPGRGRGRRRRRARSRSPSSTRVRRSRPTVADAGDRRRRGRGLVGHGRAGGAVRRSGRSRADARRRLRGGRLDAAVAGG